MSSWPDGGWLARGLMSMTGVASVTWASGAIMGAEILGTERPLMRGIFLHARDSKICRVGWKRGGRWMGGEREVPL